MSRTRQSPPRYNVRRTSNIGREWKIDLIVAGNPKWRDLYEDVVG
jgi:hypothetical protein